MANLTVKAVWESIRENHWVDFNDSPDNSIYVYDIEVLWYARNKNKYQKAEQELRDFKLDKPNYTISLGFDVSGFEYWTIQHENNYVSVTIDFKSDSFDDDIESILSDISHVKNWLDDFQNKYPPKYR